jgi:hypothetical protein
MTASWRFLAVSAVLTLAGGLHVGALAGEVNCPASLKETPGVVDPGAGWTVLARAGDRPLESVAVYWGPGIEPAAQVPDEAQKKKLIESVRWNLPRQQEPYWIACAYVGTSAVVLQKLGVELSRCVVTYDLLPSGRRLRVKAVVCT